MKPVARGHRPVRPGLCAVWSDEDAVARERVVACSSTSSSSRPTGRCDERRRWRLGSADAGRLQQRAIVGRDRRSAAAAGSAAGRSRARPARAGPSTRRRPASRPASLRTRPSSIQASTDLLEKERVAARALGEPGRHVHSDSSAPGKRAARYAPTSAVSSGAQVEAQPPGRSARGPWPRDGSRARASQHRRCGRCRRRAGGPGSRRRAIAPSRSTRRGSRSTAGPRAGARADVWRRTRAAPRRSRAACARAWRPARASAPPGASASLASHGSCASKVGARCASAATSAPAAGRARGNRAERVQDGQVGLGRAVLLDALASPDERVRRAAASSAGAPRRASTCPDPASPPTAAPPPESRRAPSASARGEPLAVRRRGRPAGARRALASRRPGARCGACAGASSEPGSCCSMRRSSSRSAADGSRPSSSSSTRRAAW